MKPRWWRSATGWTGAAVLMLFGLAGAPVAARAQAVQGPVTGREPGKTMTPGATPAFDVASIKPANPSAQRHGRMGAVIDTSPDSFRTLNATLKDLIEVAYSLEIIR